MAIDPAFFKHLEEVFPGRDIRAHNDADLHHHGSSHHHPRPRRGADHRPHQPLQHDVRPVLHGCQPGRLRARAELGRHQDDARQRHLDQAAPPDVGAVFGRRADPFAVLPGRGPLLRARSATISLQAATNGIEFAKVQEFCEKAAEAGLRYAYLQFDGIGNAANSHRAVGNLFDVKLRAIENLHSTGVDIVPVITHHQRHQQRTGGPRHPVRARQSQEDLLPELPAGFVHRPRRSRHRRAPLCPALHAVAPGARREEPDRAGRAHRDWFPISFMSTFSDWADLVHGPAADWGQSELRLPSQLRHRHGRDDRQGNQGSRPGDRVPQCATGWRKRHRSASTTPRAAQLPFGRRHGAGAAAQLQPVQRAQALQADRPAAEVRQVLRRAPAELRQGRPATAPCDDIEKRRKDRWNFLFIAGMWFQDLFNYDFRRTEQCIIPYATQEGEISFCAYNTGVGWRNIIEKMHMTATLTKWYEEHGQARDLRRRQERAARQSAEHSMVLREGIVTSRRAARPRPAGHRQDRARGEDPRPRPGCGNSRSTRT